MSLLPYTKTYAIDMTRGIASATPPASLNIASIIVADTGPIDRVTLRNQNDLVDIFCTGSSISATDNETIQYNGALLTQVATDVFRVDTSAMRIGVGSLGTKMYFDKEYNLLETVTKAQLLQKPSEITSLYIIATAADGAVSPLNGEAITGDIPYYIGDVPTNDEGQPLSGAVSLNEFRENQDAQITIEEFRRILQTSGIVLSFTEKSGNYNSVLNPAYSGLKLENKQTKFGDLCNVSFENFPGLMNIVEATEAQIPDNSYFMTINGSQGYLPDNSTATTNAEYNQSISTNEVTTLYSPRHFLVKVLDELYKSTSITDPWTQDIKIEIETNKVLDESESDIATLSKYIQIQNGSEAIDETPAVKTKITAYNASIFGLDNKSIAWVGDDNIYMIPSGMSLQAALVDLYEHIIKTDAGATISITSAAGGNPYFAYSSLGSTSIETDGVALVWSSSSTDYARMTFADDAHNPDYKTEETLYIVIDNYCFYAGKKPTEVPGYDAEANGVLSYVTVSKVEMSIPDFLKAVVGKIAEIFTVGTGFGGYFLVSGSHDFVTSSNIQLSNETILDQTKNDDSFAVVCRFTSSLPLFDFEYEAHDDEYKTIDMTYKFKTKVGSFTMSFDGNAIDGYGKSLYFDNYNEGDNANPYIYIKKLDGEGILSKFSPSEFGNEVMNNEPTEADYAATILKYLDVKEKQYDFVTDAGHVGVALAGACKQVADERFAEYFPSFPPKKDVASIKEYASSINLNDFRCYYLVPSHKSTYNGQFLTTVPASLTMIFARVNAFSTTVAEFSPLFGTVKGTATAPYMIKNFTNAEAQALADMNINVITKDVAGTYIRSNFTSQTENSYLSEEQNAYMTNVLCHICEEFNPTIIAELNTSDLRASVEENLSQRIQQRMVSGKNPTFAGFRVVCNDELNPLSVIEARQLVYQVWVQYTPSVAYVLAYVYVKRLGSF